MPQEEKKDVGLMLESARGTESRLLDGIARWINTNPGWRVAVFDGSRSELELAARDWRGDGMVSTVEDESFPTRAAAADIPVVNVTTRPLNHGSISIESDFTACGELAAEYFLDRGFRHFSFVGDDPSEFSEALAGGLRTRLEAEGASVAIFEAQTGSGTELASWLRTLPRPLAVLAASDRRGARVLEACHRADLAVPEEVAVLGIGDHTHLCELCSPPLSSIDCDMESRGFEAAALLYRLMAGESATPPPIRIPPAGVVTRRSSDTYAFDDPDLSRALRFINENAHRSIKVKDVLSATRISRRSLENRFRRFFSRSLHEEIWRVHFERAKDLLTTTDLGLQEVAERSGFRTASALANLFKQKTGLTPRTYRATHRR